MDVGHTGTQTGLQALKAICTYLELLKQINPRFFLFLGLVDWPGLLSPFYRRGN